MAAVWSGSCLTIWQRAAVLLLLLLVALLVGDALLLVAAEAAPPAPVPVAAALARLDKLPEELAARGCKGEEEGGERREERSPKLCLFLTLCVCVFNLVPSWEAPPDTCPCHSSSGEGG